MCVQVLKMLLLAFTGTALRCWFCSQFPVSNLPFDIQDCFRTAHQFVWKALNCIFPSVTAVSNFRLSYKFRIEVLFVCEIIWCFFPPPPTPPPLQWAQKISNSRDWEEVIPCLHVKMVVVIKNKLERRYRCCL